MARMPVQRSALRHDNLIEFCIEFDIVKHAGGAGFQPPIANDRQDAGPTARASGR